MPMFEFECESCHHRFEELQRATDTSTPACPSCQAVRVKKLVSAGAIRANGVSGASAGYSAPSCSVGGG